MTEQHFRNTTQGSSDGPSPDQQQFTEHDLAQLGNDEIQAAYRNAYREQLRQRGCPDCGESSFGF